jgi:CO/xanthine dehydrogenase Mo-binding subunit
MSPGARSLPPAACSSPFAGPPAFGDLAGGGEGGAAPGVVRPDLPGSLKSNPHLDSWIHIRPDGHTTVFSGKAELGQGIRTALLQVAAEELDMRPGQIEFITADTARTPDEGLTAGSHSMMDGGTALANAAANVRMLLSRQAARIWNLPPSRSPRAARVMSSARKGARRPMASLPRACP